MVPLIKIEVEHMRHAMVHAFSEQLVNLDLGFQEAVKKACDPERIQALLNETARVALEATIKSEVEAYLRYGEGQKLVKAEVCRRLKAEFQRTSHHT